MTWIKICGMTNLEDALVAVEAGADAVGFVFYEKSPRNVSVETVREIVSNLPDKIEKVGVFVSDAAERIESVFKAAGLTAIQFYPGKETSDLLLGELLSRFPQRLILALPAGAADSFAFVCTKNAADAATILIDSGDGPQPGGTGKKFDWERADGVTALFRSGRKIIVAGGLTPENIPEAVRRFSPYGVDVSSGVEAHAGKKDPEKVRAFVKAVREVDRKTG